MLGIYIKFGSTDYFFGFDRVVILNNKTISQIAQKLAAENITLTPDEIKYRALKSDFEVRAIGAGAIIDIKSDSFCFGAYKPAGGNWDHKTVFFNMLSGSKTTYGAQI